jgi:hypothetical protein
MNSKKEVVLVSTGVFQTYMKTNIDQLLKFDFNIHAIIDRTFFDSMEEYKTRITLVDSSTLQTDFDSKSMLNKDFRDGFCNNTSKRLFILNEYMKQKGLKNVIHLENDVLLYSDMKYDLDEKIYITMDEENRCVPGIVYIPNHELFDRLIQEYNYSKDDMENLAIFYNRHRDIVNTFPIIDNSVQPSIYNKEFERFHSIFDAAAMGQYLGGVDPRNIPGDTTGFVNETCIIKYNNYQFKWLKKEGHYVPHILINNNWILVNNLHIHSKRLKEFSMDNPIENRVITKSTIGVHFITGENIQLCCSHFIGRPDDFNFNPKITSLKERFIYIGNREPIDNKDSVFCYTHLLDSMQELINTLRTLRNPFKLIFHNSDNNFEKKHLVLFQLLPLLQCIYTQNMAVTHPKVYPLPIGLANSMWTHGNPDIHEAVFELDIPKDKDIYFNFNLNTNTVKRSECYNSVKNIGIPWSESLPYCEYLKELKRHKFAICPEGNGIDTHRFYECLYMKVIPICKRNILTEYYSKLLPIIVVNEWQDLDITNLTYSNINVDMLDMKHITHRLSSHL